MSLLQRIATAQSRSSAEIDADIRSEIEFHLEMRTRDLIDAGLDPDQARGRAEQQFGNVPAIAKQCRLVQLGDRVMFQRILIGIVLGGPYNSGILATGPVEGAFFNYDPAPQPVRSFRAEARTPLP